MCGVLRLPISSLYQSCQKFQIFDILRVSLAENSRVKTNPYKMVAQKARPHSGRADVIIRVVEVVLVSLLER